MRFLRWPFSACPKHAGTERLALLVLAGVLASVIAAAQESASASVPPLPADNELGRLRHNLEEVSTDESNTLAQLARLELASRIGFRETQLLDHQIAGLQADAEKQTAQMRDFEAEVAGDERAIAAIYLAAYRQRRRPPLAGSSGREAQQFARRYGGRLAREQRVRINAFRLKSRELAMKRAQVQREIHELRMVQGARADKGRELATLRGRYKLLLGAVSRQKRAFTEGLQAMEAAVKTLPAPHEPSEAGGQPWHPPLKAPISTGFGHIIDPEYHTELPHPGLDYAAPDGTPVHAAAGGLVAYAKFLEGYGETVILEHAGGYLSIYAHLRQPLVKDGQSVAAGGLLGLVGDTGSLRGAYLYFEVRKNGEPVNPAGLFAKKEPVKHPVKKH